MIAIYKKEIKTYFNLITGYIFLSIFLLIGGYYFTVGNLATQNGDIRDFFSNMVAIFIFLVPMLTMRLFAEEKKIKTEQLLLTSPVSLVGIVMGKFLAAMTVFGIGLMVTVLYPITMAFFGYADITVTIGNYIGILILVSSFVAIGIFISALTENQIIAAVVSYSVLLGLLFIGFVGQSVNNAVLTKVLDWISIMKTYTEFSMGVLNPASVLYYISLTGVFLFLTVRVLEQRRWN